MWMAGASPKRIPVRTAIAAVKPSALPSSPISDARGRMEGLKVPSMRVPAQAMASPAAAPNAGQQHGFRQELADQARASGAERTAHAHLAAARRGAREQQVGEVHAGDQQDESHGRRERQQRRANAAHDGFLQAAEGGVPPGIGIGKLLFGARRDGVEIGLRRG